jgi:hypothetical protein
MKRGPKVLLKAGRPPHKLIDSPGELIDGDRAWETILGPWCSAAALALPLVRTVRTGYKCLALELTERRP